MHIFRKTEENHKIPVSQCSGSPGGDVKPGIAHTKQKWQPHKCDVRHIKMLILLVRSFGALRVYQHDERLPFIQRTLISGAPQNKV
jgi:hypothetical protein